MAANWVLGGRRPGHWMSSTSISHITIDTGHVRASPRAEVADPVVTMLRAWISRALAGEPVNMGEVGCVMTAQQRGESLIAEVSDRELRPLATIGVGTGVGAADVWRELHADARSAATSGDSPPGTPWVAARLRPDIGRAASWLGDFERCLAWAWMER